MANRAQAFEADKQYAYRALQDARQYVTDVDRTGRKAEAIYERLARAGGMLRPWSTDGTPEQAKKAIEYIREITSILSEKIGPASRREFPDQDKSPAQLEREIAAGKPTTRRSSGKKVSHATRKSPVETKFTASIRLSGAPAAMQTREFKHRVDAQTWLDQQRDIADRRGWSDYKFELTEQHEVKRNGR